MAVKVPTGSVAVNEKWRETELVSILKRNVEVLVFDSAEIADFYPVSNLAIVFVREGDVVSGTSFKRKLVKLRKLSSTKNMVIVEKTDISDQYFFNLQKFAVMELGLGMVPVSSEAECAQLLIMMVNNGRKKNSNPFLTKQRLPPMQVSLLNCLSKIPSLDREKAEFLLSHFQSLKRIGEASASELSQLIGSDCAVEVFDFFHSL